MEQKYINKQYLGDGVIMYHYDTVQDVKDSRDYWEKLAEECGDTVEFFYNSPSYIVRERNSRVVVYTIKGVE